MMGRKTLPLTFAVAAFLSVLALPFTTAADKFSDSLTQAEPLPAPSPVAAPPALKQPAMKDPSLTTIPDFSKGLPVAEKPVIFKSPADVKPLKISVSNYEDKFQEMLLSEFKAKAKKKRFAEGILDELKRYSVYILLGLVGILVAYAMHKDRIRFMLGAPGKDGDKKKDIWKEDF